MATPSDASEQAHARPLLKFDESDESDSSASLAPEGIELLKQLPESCQICPVILMGDGRAGKSYLGSRILGIPNAFHSSDSPSAVTEGIDILTAPVAPLLSELGMEEEVGEEQYLLVLDCEGADNAMAEIRQLVNMLGMMIGTEIVFIANGMASEQSLQTLATTLEARSMLSLGATAAQLQQRLVFVVNKNTIRYSDDALEKILDASYEHERAEFRESLRHAFPERVFKTVPLMSTPDFEDHVALVRKAVLDFRQPLSVAGQLLRPKQLCGLLDSVVAEAQKTSEVSSPTISRYVIYEGFLAPIVERLAKQGKEEMPSRDSAYDPDLEIKDCRGKIMATFDEEVAHIEHHEHVEEAREKLRGQLDSAWSSIEQENTAKGNDVVETSMETREVVSSTQQHPKPFGGDTVLADLPVHKEFVCAETRMVLRRKNGGVEYSEWELAKKFPRLVETSLERLGKLPRHEARLWELSTGALSYLVTLGAGFSRERFCTVRDGCFYWFNAESQEVGCINFMLQDVEVTADEENSIFSLSPAKGYWEEPYPVRGDSSSSFVFERRSTAKDKQSGSLMGAFVCGACCAAGQRDKGINAVGRAKSAAEGRDEWVDALREHMKFGTAVAKDFPRDVLLKALDAGKKRAQKERKVLLQMPAKGQAQSTMRTPPEVKLTHSA